MTNNAEQKFKLLIDIMDVESQANTLTPFNYASARQNCLKKIGTQPYHTFQSSENLIASPQNYCKTFSDFKQNKSAVRLFLDGAITNQDDGAIWIDHITRHSIDSRLCAMTPGFDFPAYEKNIYGWPVINLSAKELLEQSTELPRLDPRQIVRKARYEILNADGEISNILDFSATAMGDIALTLFNVEDDLYFSIGFHDYNANEDTYKKYNRSLQKLEIMGADGLSPQLLEIFADMSQNEKAFDHIIFESSKMGKKQIDLLKTPPEEVAKNPDKYIQQINNLNKMLSSNKIFKQLCKDTPLLSKIKKLQSAVRPKERIGDNISTLFDPTKARTAETSRLSQTKSN